MKKIIRVAIYGSNLIISSIAARLSQRPQFQLRQINGLMPEILDQPDGTPTDALLFDLEVTKPDFAGRILQQHPTMILIGVDLVGNRMLIFSGKQSRFLTEDDLAQVLEANQSQNDSSILNSLEKNNRKNSFENMEQNGKT